MATRAIIELFNVPEGFLIDGVDKFRPKNGIIMLYRHWDGYPDLDSGVLETWQAFIRAHYPRGTQYMYQSKDQIMGFATEAIKYFWIDKAYEGDSKLGRPGLELTAGMHLDIDYYYQIIFDSEKLTIRAYERTGYMSDHNFDPMGALVKEIRISNKEA